MSAISNDSEFRRALESLSGGEQRIAGGRFVESVLGLCGEPLVQRAVAVAIDGSSSSQEIDEAYRGSKSVAVKTYTACGRDTDWLAQAEHFVAAAAAACLQPEPTPSQGASNAWKAAMQARMAKNCEMIETGAGEAAGEAQKQYEILERALAEKA